MKILYGVQATGQGHISRARAMAKALGQHAVDVTWLFSGRSAERLFDMEPFGNFEHRRGLTFATRVGRIRYLETVTSNNVFEFWRDIRGLDLSPYDIIVTDYEPVTAWAARLAGSEGVICNSGFELISECIQWQKPVLTRPLAGQMEQLSNALALQELGYAQVMETLCGRTLRQWLASPGRRQPVHFADVALKLAQWLATGCSTGVQKLSQDLWSNSLTAGQLHVHQPVYRSSIPNPRTEALSA